MLMMIYLVCELGTLTRKRKMLVGEKVDERRK